jgi:porphobilinogen synthase
LSFPTDRPRRLRRTAALRRLVRETDVLPRHLVQPLFVDETAAEDKPIGAMPGQSRHAPANIGAVARQCEDLGVPAVLLFGIPREKDAAGTEAWNDDGVVQQAVRSVRESAPSLAVMADLCLCEYTSHGHCGVLDHGVVVNDETLPLLARTAASYARAGAHVVAPSGMMDGGVAAVRMGLDDDGHADVAIMAYAVKYASAYYGPFREAADSAPEEGDRRGYQMDPANAREADVEAFLDEGEGADVLMVKPAGPYLDVIKRVRDMTSRPVAAYQVSGEYSMIQASAAQGLIDGRAVMWESVGADIVITYFARELAREHREHGTS